MFKLVLITDFLLVCVHNEANIKAL